MKSLKEDDTIDLLYFLHILAKHHRMIIGLFCLTVIVTAIISLLLPKIYSATVTIMPPQNPNTVNPLGAKIQEMTGAMGSMFGLAGPDTAELYVDMLRSRSILDKIIKRFGLLKEYNVQLYEDAREQLNNSVKIKTSKSNMISITVEDKVPQQAADLANAFIEELDRLNKRFNISDASHKRIFIEERLMETKQNLDLAEKRLKEFQEENKIVALAEQAKAAIAGAAKIKGEIIATEIEIETLKGFATEKTNESIMLKQRLKELNEQLAKIEKGDGIKRDIQDSADNKQESKFYISFSDVPSISLQLARLMREVKTLETVFDLLTQQYEMVKIAEAKDMSVIQIIDKAEVPKKRSKPRRALIIIISGIMSLVVSVFIASTLEYLEKIEPEDKQLLEGIRRTFKESIAFIKR